MCSQYTVRWSCTTWVLTLYEWIQDRVWWISMDFLWKSLTSLSWIFLSHTDKQHHQQAHLAAQQWILARKVCWEAYFLFIYVLFHKEYALKRQLGCCHVYKGINVPEVRESSHSLCECEQLCDLNIKHARNPSTQSGAAARVVVRPWSTVVSPCTLQHDPNRVSDWSWYKHF